MKFPERLIYGLLRNYGRHSSIDTKILIEEATEYKKSNVKLRKQLPRQLNMQAIYRGENFKVTHSDYKTKGEAIGLEMTDILLGIVRTIIKKSAIRFSETKSAYTTDYIFFERYSVL